MFPSFNNSSDQPVFVPGKVTANSSANSPSECKLVDKIPRPSSSDAETITAPAPSPKITETPRPSSDISNPNE